MMMKKYLAVLLFTLPSAHATTVFTILDQYTNDVPTGTSYQELTYYDQYVDAGSVDASPFVINKRTPHQGGILFYGSTELVSKAESNTYRLTSATGLFDFTSFNLQGLEANVDERTAFTIPKITITSSTGDSREYTATVDAFDFGGGEIYYSYDFFDSGVQTLDWTDVEWVDFTTQYAKAKTSDFVLATDISAVPEASTSLGLLALGAGGLFTRRRLKRAAWTV